MKSFKLPPNARQLPIQVDMPESDYTRRLREIRKARFLSKGEPFLVSSQCSFKVGDLVVWEPTGALGLWSVTACDNPYDLGQYPAPFGKIRLRWRTGWKGYESKGHPVCVLIGDIRFPNEMELLALAAS